jgi:hypothetical protein
MIGFASTHGATILDYSRFPIFNAIFWTKADLWAEPEFAGLSAVARARIPLASAGSLLMRVSPENQAFLAVWFALATRGAGHLVDDTPSRSPPVALFFEHRHDQAIFSLLKTIHGLPSFGDALAYDFTCSAYLRAWPELRQRPFLALRNRSGSSAVAAASFSGRCRVGMLSGLPRYCLDTLRMWRLGREPRGGTENIGIALTRQHQQELQRLELLPDCA